MIFFNRMKTVKHIMKEMMKRYFCLVALSVLSMAAFAQTHAVSVGNYKIYVSLLGEAVEIPVDVTNEGTADVESIGYTVTSANGEKKEYRYALPEKLSGKKASVTLRLPVEITEKEEFVAKEIAVTQVNGHDNEAESGQMTSQGHVILVRQASPRKVVMEEFTATWCVNCPRGIVAMEKLQRLFSEQFIGIAVHCDDIMACKGYSSLMQEVAGIPYAFVNRWKEGDPYWGYEKGRFGMKEIVERCLSEQTEASVDVRTAVWSDDEKKIKLLTDVVFQYNRESSPYALGYVLVEDGLSGTTNHWNQRNNLMDFPEFAGDEDFKRFYEGKSIITNMVYNHVAMGGWKPAKGYDGSIVAPIVAGQTQTHEMTLDISGISGIQDKKRLKAVALLIDRDSKRIVNADELELGKFLPTDISETKADTKNKEIAYIYSLDGVRRQTLSKGFNIVRYADGTTKVVNQH